MAENEEWAVQDVIEEVDEYYDPYQGNKTGLWGVDIEDSAQEKQGTTATRDRSRTTGGAHYSGCSHHEQDVL